MYCIFVQKIQIYADIAQILPYVADFAKSLDVNTAHTNDEESPIIDYEVADGRISRGLRRILNRVDWSSCGDHAPYQHISLTLEGPRKI